MKNIIFVGLTSDCHLSVWFDRKLKVWTAQAWRTHMHEIGTPAYADTRDQVIANATLAFALQGAK